MQRKEFDSTKPMYEPVLHHSRYKTEIKRENHKTKTSRKRNSKVKWFKSLFSQNVKTNRKLYFKIIHKHFFGKF